MAVSMPVTTTTMATTATAHDDNHELMRSSTAVASDLGGVDCAYDRLQPEPVLLVETAG